MDGAHVDYFWPCNVVNSAAFVTKKSVRPSVTLVIQDT